MLKPGKPVPALEFDTVGGGRWSLAAQKPQNFTLLVSSRASTIQRARLEEEPMTVGEELLAPRGWTRGKHAR